MKHYGQELMARNMNKHDFSTIETRADSAMEGIEAGMSSATGDTGGSSNDGSTVGSVDGGRTSTAGTTPTRTTPARKARLSALNNTLEVAGGAKTSGAKSTAALLMKLTEDMMGEFEKMRDETAGLRAELVGVKEDNMGLKSRMEEMRAANRAVEEKLVEAREYNRTMEAAMGRMEASHTSAMMRMEATHTDAMGRLEAAHTEIKEWMSNVSLGGSSWATVVSGTSSTSSNMHSAPGSSTSSGSACPTTLNQPTSQDPSPRTSYAATVNKTSLTPSPNLDESPGVVINVSRVKERIDELEKTPGELEKQIREAIISQATTADITIKGIRVNRQAVKVFTSTAHKAARLHTNKA